jgi:hypothetical protein
VAFVGGELVVRALFILRLVAVRKCKKHRTPFALLKRKVWHAEGDLFDLRTCEFAIN